MNDRIDVLALQATDSKGGLDRQKFAELIVLECADLVKIKTNDQIFTNETYQRGYLDARADSAFMIKEHFGVKK